jgi:hypothetical protein
MLTRINQRTATQGERSALEKLLAAAPTATTRLKRGAGNAFLLWATSLLCVVVIWFAIAWLVGKVWVVDLGMRSPVALWVVGVAMPGCAVFAVISSIRWVRTWTDYRQLLREDLAKSQVNEEEYTFNEAKRFQEPEHGGLIYFLRSEENEVFTVYDPESQTLGIDDKDPLQSSYRPQSGLLIVRAPKSGFVLSSLWSGVVLDAGAPIELAVAPEDWPESETLCNIPWSELEARLASATRRQIQITE